MQGDGQEAALGLQLLILLEVVIQQGPEVVTAAAEEGLGEAGLRMGGDLGPELKAGVGVQGEKAWHLVTEEVITLHSEADVRTAIEAIAREGQLPEITLGGREEVPSEQAGEGTAAGPSQGPALAHT